MENNRLNNNDNDNKYIRIKCEELCVDIQFQFEKENGEEKYGFQHFMRKVQSYVTNTGRRRGTFKFWKNDKADALEFAFVSPSYSDEEFDDRWEDLTTEDADEMLNFKREDTADVVENTFGERATTTVGQINIPNEDKSRIVKLCRPED